MLYSFTRKQSFESKKCPYCHSNHTKKNGKKHNKQNYQCKDCQRQFMSKKRINNEQLWQEYTTGKQTYSQLAHKYQCSIKTIQRRLDKAKLHYQPTQIKHANIIMDTTYFGRQFALMVFMDYTSKTVLDYQIIHYETNDLYKQGIRLIQSQGIEIQSITCDGRRGLLGSFNVPMQMCQFHQQQIITRYLTRNPKNLASQSLRRLSLDITKLSLNQFNKRLNECYLTHEWYFNERSQNVETGKTWYTHKRLRSAYRSLRNNARWLFVYRENTDNLMPNTTNALEGLFSELKRQLSYHNGLNYERKLRFIHDFLRNRMAG